MHSPVYLDHNATTPADPLVVEAMLPYLTARFGNPSSRHEYGRTARQAIDEARRQVAAALGAHPTEVVFTSGGSEANNLLIKGAAACLRPGLIAISAIEHPCVLRPAEQLARRGWTVEQIAVDALGRVEVGAFQEIIARKPKIVSVMMANNETGVVQDVEWLAGAARRSGAWFHTDAVQAVGKIAVDFRRLNAAGVHAMTLSAHKIGGPKGAAALILDKRVDLEPLIAGGGHERGLRSGTENVAAIVGFGVACELAVQRRVEASRKLLELRSRIETGLRSLGAVLFGQGAERLPNTVFFAFPEIDGETLVGQLDRAGYAVASGAACSSANPEPSHVLRAMGVPAELARGAVRASLGPESRPGDVDGLLAAVWRTVARLKGLAAVAV
ncbi:cysteine desulfurase family protein [Accumulibacter sp.]|uniref:cysteine desulfurase family protein n=1 Tax=Accumulibacter sp. TaxID=2053492 RepID=UPI0025FEE1A5|nr:cysteine desulfurase family protein [Accumulibacter sp.]MCM8595037.1 cysteine desulfurase [Accumulibacter sp.]MCM8625420.1 cysteine desulfurase [Accumulibacter sp.]MDS4049183.1 cysteine desulfurase family protein [Accumulibacter sp.]